MTPCALHHRQRQPKSVHRLLIHNDNHYHCINDYYYYRGGGELDSLIKVLIERIRSRARAKFPIRIDETKAEFSIRVDRCKG